VKRDLTENELIIGGIHAKLLTGRGHFTRHEADVLLRSHDALRLRVDVLEEAARELYAAAFEAGVSAEMLLRLKEMILREMPAVMEEP
jgi:hypothetical protein